MPENLPSIILFSLFIGIALLVLVRVAILQCAPTKTISATVADKQKTETFSKYSGSGMQERYVVIFSANGKKHSFYVSRFSYDGYRIGQKGTLTYKGKKLLSFQ